MYGTACLDVSKLLQALPKELNRFGSHSLDKATEFIPEILPSSQISHRILLNHCRLFSKAFTVTVSPWTPRKGEDSMTPVLSPPLCLPQAGRSQKLWSQGPKLG